MGCKIVTSFKMESILSASTLMPNSQTSSVVSVRQDNENTHWFHYTHCCAFGFGSGGFFSVFVVGFFFFSDKA